MFFPCAAWALHHCCPKSQATSSYPLRSACVLPTPSCLSCTFLVSCMSFYILTDPVNHLSATCHAIQHVCLFLQGFTCCCSNCNRANLPPGRLRSGHREVATELQVTAGAGLMSCSKSSPFERRLLMQTAHLGLPCVKCRVNCNLLICTSHWQHSLVPFLSAR